MYLACCTARAGSATARRRLLTLATNAAVHGPRGATMTLTVLLSFVWWVLPRPTELVPNFKTPTSTAQLPPAKKGATIFKGESRSRSCTHENKVQLSRLVMQAQHELHSRSKAPLRPERQM
jgi:hypothetical protein